MRMSAAITIINELTKRGAKIKAYDPKAEKEAKEAGVKLAVGGKGMLLWQGAASYKLYTGLEMPTDEYQKFQAENEGK